MDKRKSILWILAVVFMQSCSQPDNKAEERTDEKTAQESSTTGSSVTLSIESESFPYAKIPEEVQVRMTNHTTDTIITGMHYRIEVLNDNKWSVISPDDMFFIEIAYELKPAEERSFDTPLLTDRILYKAGKYRIVKYYIPSGYQNERIESHDLYAEFSIE
jgi:hypothetical protein